MAESSRSEPNQHKRRSTRNSGTDTSRPNAGSLTGERIGRYLVGHRIGSGGAATVYQAYDQVRGRSVALKVLLPGADEVTRSRFRQEAHTAGSLRHPHIVETLQVGTSPADGVAYIAMDLIEGESLGDLLERRGQLHPAETCNLLEPIARALAFAHERGVIHRDVKPSNILLKPSRPGAPGSVQLEAVEYPVIPLLTDFGIARALDRPELTSAGRTIGTPAYMAPEQCAGDRDIDGRADIYSLSAVLYRCLVGRAPFGGSTIQVLHAHVYDPLTIPDNVLAILPPLVVDILRKGMAKERSERYANCAEMAKDMGVVAGRTPGPATETASELDSTATLTLTSVSSAVPAQDNRRTETVLVPSPHSTANAGPRGASVLHRRRAAAPTPAPAPDTAGPRITQDRPTGARDWIWPLAGAMAALVLAVVLITAVRVLPYERLPIENLPFGNPETLAWLFDAQNQEAGPVDDSESPAGPTATPTADQIGGGPQEDGGMIALPTPALSPDANGAEGAVATDTPTPSPTWTSTHTATPLPTVTPTYTPTPVPPTETPTPTATPTATEEPTPTATATWTPTATPDLFGACTVEPVPVFAEYLYNNLNTATDIGCPVDEGSSMQYEVQPFQGGLVLNRLDGERIIYILNYPDGGWNQYPNTWEPNMPESVDDPSLQPPSEGLYVPERGIGKLWAENEAIRRQLSWASAPAEPTQGNIQSYEGGTLISNNETGDVYRLLHSQRQFTSRQFTSIETPDREDRQ